MKIDISSLDSATKQKIEQYHKRCFELDNVVEKPITLNCQVGVIWDSLEPTPVDVVSEKDLWDQINKAQEEFLEEIKKEAKEIVQFSDEIALKLGADKLEFWNQYFLGDSMVEQYVVS